MPPQEEDYIAHVVSSSDGEEDGSTSAASSVGQRSSSSWTDQLILDSQAAARRHNVPTHVGWRRNTFHWELNIYTAIFFAWIYYCLLPVPYRVVFHVGGALLLLDIARYYIQKQDMPGVPYTFPLVTIVAMLVRPVRFWAELACIAMESGQGVCTNLLGGKFMIFCTDTALARQVMTAEGTFQIYAHPNALWLFGPKNLIYMKTDAHKQFRKMLSPALFGKEALEQYTVCQDQVCRQYMKRYAERCRSTGAPVDVRLAFRAMAAASSQEAFLGPYLTDKLRSQLETDIVSFTMGFLSFPFPYCNSGLHQAIKAKNRIESTLEELVPKARDYIQQGHPPRCLMERWCETIRDAKRDGTLPDCMNDDDVARTILDFLFAAQDATNSALVYSLDVLDENRHVLNKLRNEVAQGKHEYMAKIANKLLHHKPPVPMIPHMARKRTQLGGRHISAGTVVIPSITYSARTSGQSLHFDGETDAEDSQFIKTVTFGAGQHKCPGRRYAESFITTFLRVLAAEYDFCRVGPRPGFDEFIYFPTVFPKDCDFIIQALPPKES